MGLDTKPATLGRAAADDALVAHVAEVLMSWCASVDDALAQSLPGHEVSMLHFHNSRCCIGHASDVSPRFMVDQGEG